MASRLSTRTTLMRLGLHGPAPEVQHATHSDHSPVGSRGGSLFPRRPGRRVRLLLGADPPGPGHREALAQRRSGWAWSAAPAPEHPAPVSGAAAARLRGRSGSSSAAGASSSPRGPRGELAGSRDSARCGRLRAPCAEGEAEARLPTTRRSPRRDSRANYASSIPTEVNEMGKRVAVMSTARQMEARRWLSHPIPVGPALHRQLGPRLGGVSAITKSPARFSAPRQRDRRRGR